MLRGSGKPRATTARPSSIGRIASTECRPPYVGAADFLLRQNGRTGVRPIRAGCRAVRDSTLVTWYRSLYAPRAGGAYDSHHRTAGIAGRARRRGGRVAARGARAAAEGVDHR